MVHKLEISVRILKNILGASQGKDTIKQKSGVIYWYRCSTLACHEEYIEESTRIWGGRFKEHLKACSPTFEHQSKPGHNTSVENFSIVGREGHNLARTIKESIYIKS